MGSGSKWIRDLCRWIQTYDYITLRKNDFFCFPMPRFIPAVCPAKLTDDLLDAPQEMLDFFL